MGATSRNGTRRLYDDLEAEGIDPDWFADLLAEWKSLGPAGEYSSFYFGKDGACRTKAGRAHGASPAHLPPVDAAALAERCRQHRRRRRRTSDACFIYAHAYGHLLLYIAHEPNGHAISDMRVASSARFMNQLADAAEAFIFDGSVVP